MSDLGSKQQVLGLHPRTQKELWNSHGWILWMVIQGRTKNGSGRS